MSLNELLGRCNGGSAELEQLGFEQRGVSANIFGALDGALKLGDRGTVRWAGGVEGTEGRWLGVEWDTEGRGRHDGDHQGTKYFQPHR